MKWLRTSAWRGSVGVNHVQRPLFDVAAAGRLSSERAFSGGGLPARRQK